MQRVLRGGVKPENCPHLPLKIASDIHYEIIVSKAKCKECGMKTTVQISMAKAQAQQELSVLQYIEQRCRRMMVVYARKAAGLPL